MKCRNQTRKGEPIILIVGVLFSTLGVLLCCGTANDSIIQNSATMWDYKAVSSGSLSRKYLSGSTNNILPDPDVHDPLCYSSFSHKVQGCGKRVAVKHLVVWCLAATGNLHSG
jgi:hypothetical protein